MGRLIICHEKTAEKPYLFKLTNTSIYTIEELSYYIYNNINLITDELYDPALAEWMKEELHLTDRYNLLIDLIKNQGDLKDIVVCILCSGDYYTENEIIKIIQVIDERVSLTPFETKLKKAANYIKYKQYSNAEYEYELLLKEQQILDLSEEEVGDLLHNLGLAKFHTTGVNEACQIYLKAYEKNKNTETFKQYLLTLYLRGRENQIKEEITAQELNDTFYEEFMDELNLSLGRYKTSSNYKEIEEVIKVKESGQIAKYYQDIDKIIKSLKQEFRQETLS